jgi:parvulin-like peptidyl-prolyl isomerase
MVKPFGIAAFAATKDEIVGPVQSNFGYHIIHVRDKKSENGLEQVLASHILLQVEMSPTTLANLKREATLFSYDAQDDGFTSAVQSNQVTTGTQNKLTGTGFSIRGLGGFRAAIRFAFNAEISQSSDVMENDKYFSVFTLDAITPPGIKPYEEVEAQLKGKLKKEKVMDATLERANNLLVKIAGDAVNLNQLIDTDSELDGIKDESKTLVQGFTSIGRSNYVTGALLAAEPGEILGPLETGRGHAIIEIMDISQFDSTEYETQKESLQTTIFNRKQKQYFQAWLDNLKNNAEIVDNRKFYF